MTNTKTKDSRFLIFLVISLWGRHLVVLKKSIPFAPSITIQPSLVLPKSRSMERKQSHFLIGLKQEKSGPLGARIEWNFAKFLINREGQVVERFSSKTDPLKMEDAIKALLNN